MMYNRAPPGTPVFAAEGRRIHACLITDDGLTVYFTEGGWMTVDKCFKVNVTAPR